MVGIEQGLGKLFFAPCGGKGVDFPAEVFLGKAGFIGGTGTASVKGAAHGAGKDREGHPLRKAFESEHDLRSGALLYAVENSGILAKQGKVGNKAG